MILCMSAAQSLECVTVFWIEYVLSDFTNDCMLVGTYGMALLSVMDEISVTDGLITQPASALKQFPFI